MEKVIFLGRDIETKKLVLTIGKTGTDSLEEVSGIQARRLNPKLYLEKPMEIDGVKGILFEKK